jgi:hypothetical protein
MPSYLIDSDILVDFFRQNASAMNYLDSLGDWSVSIVTAMEIGNLGYNLMKSYAKSDGLETPDALIAATNHPRGTQARDHKPKAFREYRCA